MPSLRSLTDAQFQKLLENKPEFAKQVDELLTASGTVELAKDALAVGGQAPGFELPDARGHKQSLAGFLANGPVVLMFYRGGWCPYCNLQLRAMQERFDEIKALGAELVAISAQVPDESLSQVERDALQFHVLSNQDAKVSSAYGVAWEVPELLISHMCKDRGLDLAPINGGNGRVLSIPATFVLRRDGAVAWREVNVDYRNRAEPDEVIGELRGRRESF